jgi:putative oxidoreductase
LKNFCARECQEATRIKRRRSGSDHRDHRFVKCARVGFVVTSRGRGVKGFTMDASTKPSRSSVTSSVTPLDRLAPYVLSILRIMAALLFLEHGLSKFFGFPSANGPHPQPFELEWFAALIEFGGGILLTLGLFTRAAAFIMSGEMAIGYFLFHAPQGFYPILNHGEAAILYCFVFLYLVFVGAGPLSLDALLRKGRRMG